MSLSAHICTVGSHLYSNHAAFSLLVDADPDSPDWGCTTTLAEPGTFFVTRHNEKPLHSNHLEAVCCFSAIYLDIVFQASLGHCLEITDPESGKWSRLKEYTRSGVLGEITKPRFEEFILTL